MAAYWFLFAYFAIGGMLTREAGRGRPIATSLPILFGAILVALAVGLRYEVGGDWEQYKFLFSFARYADLGRMLGIGDPGYQFLNWLIQRVGLGLWAVNVVCGTVFTWGLYRFAKTQPDPWLVFAVAIPYLVIVVAMGYTRQAVAIGIILAGLSAMERSYNVIRFAIYVAIAALYHKTAVVVLPLVILSGSRNRLLNLLIGAAGTIILYDIFLSESVESFVNSYVKTEYSSQGAAIRVAMNFVPAAIYFIFRRRLRFSPSSDGIWRAFSIVSLLMPIVLIVAPSSTAVDRIALYFIPLQIAVLPRVSALFATPLAGRALVLFYSATVLFIWLNFAVHADEWIPYRIVPILG